MLGGSPRHGHRRTCSIVTSPTCPSVVWAADSTSIVLFVGQRRTCRAHRQPQGKGRGQHRRANITVALPRSRTRPLRSADIFRRERLLRPQSPSRWDCSASARCGCSLAGTVESGRYDVVQRGRPRSTRGTSAGKPAPFSSTRAGSEKAAVSVALALPSRVSPFAARMGRGSEIPTVILSVSTSPQGKDAIERLVAA